MTLIPNLRVDPGDADLGHDQTVFSNLNIVSDVNQIIDFRSGSDARFAGGRAIHGDIGADLDVVFHDHSADLRNLVVDAALRGKAVAVGAQHRAGLNNHA